MGSAAILELIFLISDLLVMAPLQYAKLKQMVKDGTLTDSQVDDLIAASERGSDELIAEVDNL